MFEKRLSADSLLAALCAAVMVGLASVAGCQRQAQDTPTHPEVREQAGAKPAPPPIPADKAKLAPDFGLPRAGGGTAKLSDYAGKVLVLDFWSTTCIPCLEEMPEYQRLYDQWDHDKVEYLGMSLDARIEVVEAFLKRERLTLPMALCDADTRQAYLGEGVTPIPQAWVIDRKGRVRYELGPGPAADKMEGAVATLLAEAE